jgi:integrase
MMTDNATTVLTQHLTTEQLEDLELQKKAKDYIINNTVDMLFDSIMTEILEAGSGFSSKEVKQMSLYKRKGSPYYYASLTYGNLPRIRRSTCCENKRDAEKVKLHLLLKMMNLVPASNQNQLCPMEPQENLPPFFSEVSQKYLDEKASTLISYKREMMCHKDVIKHFGTKRVDKITPQDINSFIQKERTRKVRGGKTLSARSINYNRGYLHRVFEFAQDVYDWVQTNPVNKIDPLPQDNMRDRVLSPEEEKILLPCIEKEWLKDIVNFTLLTGLREGEVAGLRKSNFQMDGEIPYFKLKREKGKIWTEFPVIFPELAGIINKYLYSRSKGDTFFCDEAGKQLNASKIYNHYRKAVKKTSLKHLVFQDLRRTFFSRIRLNGCNPTVAEYLMGHKQKELVARYLSYNLNSIAEELKRIERLKDIYVTHTSHFDKNRGIAEDVKMVPALV